MQDFYTLGISAYAHDASCALLKNGEIRAMAEEERFNRQKHTTAFPEEAIRFCLEREGISADDVGEIAFFWNPFLEVTGNLGHFLRFFPASLHLLSAPSGGEMNFLQRLRRMRGVGEEFRQRFVRRSSPKTLFFDHHLCHAASAFYPSPFSEAAILTLDGRGEACSTLLSVGSDRGIQKLQEIKVPHSIGHFYAALTDYLGFTSFFEEWKVMGMSAYGSDRYVEAFADLISVGDDGSFRLNLDYFRFHTHGQSAWLSPKFLEKFGPPRGRGNPYGQDDYDIAFALQKSIEQAGLGLAKRLRRLSGSKNLCLAGGVVLNCLMNREIVEKSGFENFFFQPVANDAGTSLGAALLAHHGLRKQRDRHRLSHLYFGPDYSPRKIEEVLQKNQLSYRRSDQIERETAQHLSEGKIIGWFQGRMESGPRALGNRSILADPTRSEMKERLNARVKRRENFRPFAPAVLAERASDFFELPKGIPSPYMMLIGNVREEVRSLIPAVTHVDGTARIQTVSQQDNPLFWRLLREFEGVKGVPILLNTSFNENEPIVCTPEQAVACFLRTDFDVLAIGDFLVEKCC